MTIGIGLLCGDGVVLCSDRQHTTRDGFKFEAGKIFRHGTEQCEIAYCYAGTQDDAKAMFRVITEQFDDALRRAKGKHSTDRAHKALIEVYKDKTAKSLQTMVAICFPRESCVLFRTHANLVVEGHTEYIGVGDCSALRYLTSYFLDSIPDTVEEGQVLASYLVSVANRFVDGCGGGPDAVLLHLDGSLGDSFGGPFPHTRERFLYCEQQVGNVLRELVLSGGTLEALTRSIFQKSEPEQ